MQNLMCFVGEFCFYPKGYEKPHRVLSRGVMGLLLYL